MVVKWRGPRHPCSRPPRYPLASTIRLSLRSVWHSDGLQVTAVYDPVKSACWVPLPPAYDISASFVFGMDASAYLCMVCFSLRHSTYSLSPPKGRKILLPDHPLREGQAERPPVTEHPQAEDGGHGREKARSCVDEAGGEGER